MSLATATLKQRKRHDPEWGFIPFQPSPSPEGKDL
jgi:hypothetical protein